MAGETTSIGKLLVELLFKDTDFKKGVASAERSFQTLVSSAMVVAKGLAAVGTVVAALGGAAIKTGADFETYETRLTTLLGSADAAKKRMEELFEVAKTTPFNLQSVVDAEVTLEAFGVDAPKWRNAVIDLAGAMGMDLTEAAQSVGRAFAGGAGAADILRERGVLSMIELRTGIKATEMSAERFREELFAALTDPEGRFSGGAKRMSTTFSGMVSNLQDSWTGFLKDVADAGVFDGAKEGLRIVLELLDENKASVRDLAGVVSDTLVVGILGIVKAIGAIIDAWTTFKALVVGLQGQAKELEIAFLTAARGYAKLFGDEEMQASLTASIAAANAEMAALDQEALRLANSLGDAGRFADEVAERIARAAAGGGTLKDHTEGIAADLEKAKAAAEGMEIEFKQTLEDVQALNDIQFTQTIQDVREAQAEGQEAAAKAAADMRAAADDAAKAQMDHTIGAISAVQGGLEGIVTLIGGPVAGAVAGLILNLEGTVGAIKEQLLALPGQLVAAPGLLTDLIITFVEDVIPALAEALPELVEALIVAVLDPKFLAALVMLGLNVYFGILMHPEVIVAVVKALVRGLQTAIPILIREVAFMFVSVWQFFRYRLGLGELLAEAWETYRSAFVPSLVEAFLEVAAVFIEAVKEGLSSMLTSEGREETRSKTADLAREIVTLGNAETASFGDTPGAVRAGAAGLFAGFKPGDFVVAAQDPLSVLGQAAALVGKMGRGGGASPVALTVMAEGRVLDQVLVTATARGNAPGIVKQIRRASGVSVGFDRGKFNPWGP